jgi:L-serine dehydratase
LYSYNSLKAIIADATAKNTTIAAIVLPDQAAHMGIPAEDLYAQMRENLNVMRTSAVEGMRPGLKSVSGLTGGDGLKLHQYNSQAVPLSGKFAARATALALGIQELNAAMGRIVAAPTAGSCGILPAGIITFMEQKNASEEAAIDALITAGAVGMVVATRATISGAAGGCQAECGAAAAMTAAALVQLQGGTPAQSGHAAAISLSNLLGLVCDPVAGLVEVPCILRNGAGIAIAINSADMAMAGIESLIPVDEVISAMGEVGRGMPETLRETGRGGLASTPTGNAIREKLFG